MSAAGFAVYQSGFAVFGCGPTIEDAVSDANEWLDKEVEVSEVQESRGHGEVAGHLYVSPATERLVAAVRANGGHVAYDHGEDGVIDIAGVA